MNLKRNILCTLALLCTIVLMHPVTASAAPASGWQQRGSRWIYCDSSGNPIKSCWMKDSHSWCYLGSDGYLVTDAWIKDSYDWCYLDSEGHPTTNTWIMDSQDWCYLNSDGYPAINSWVMDSYDWCYLDSEGHPTTNTWIMDSQDWCYLNSDGYPAINSWVMDSYDWCYLDSEGHPTTNAWIMDSQDWCYLNSDGYPAINSWVMDSYDWCYLDREGHPTTNTWIMDSQDWCYLNSDGYLATNSWVMDSYNWCYLNSDGHLAKNTWQKDSKGWCFLDREGHLTVSNWVYSDSSGYYTYAFTTPMMPGWDATYYVDGSGRMVTGWQLIDHNEYYFFESGKAAKDQIVDGFYVDGDGFKHAEADSTTENQKNLERYIIKNGKIRTDTPSPVYTYIRPQSGRIPRCEFTANAGSTLEFKCILKNETTVTISIPITTGSLTPSVSCSDGHTHSQTDFDYMRYTRNTVLSFPQDVRQEMNASVVQAVEMLNKALNDMGFDIQSIGFKAWK